MRIVFNAIALLPLIGAALMIAGLSASWYPEIEVPGWNLIMTDLGGITYTSSVGVALVVPIAILTAVPSILSLVLREFSGKKRLAVLPIVLTIAAFIFIMGGDAFAGGVIEYGGTGYILSMAGMVIGVFGQLFDIVLSPIELKIER